MGTLRTLATLGKFVSVPIILKNIKKGITSEFLPYSSSLAPGGALLLTAIAAGATAYRAKSTNLTGRVLLAATALGSGALAVLNIGHFLWQADCLGNELKVCEDQSYCHPEIQSTGLSYLYKRVEHTFPGVYAYTETIPSKCGL